MRRKPNVVHEKSIQLQLPTKCQHVQEAHDMSAVPVSNTSTRDLIDSTGQSMEGMTSYDRGGASMHLMKKTYQNILAIPTSLTRSRKYMSVDRDDRVGMAPY
jgi:hypothetical protein